MATRWYGVSTMSDTEKLTTRLERYAAALTARDQRHVLRFWEGLDEPQQAALLSDIESIPWEIVDPLIASHVLRAPERTMPERIEPAPLFPAIPSKERGPEYDRARGVGRALLSDGKVAAFTVAGGQGTRLGVDGPKGCVPVTPVGGITLFELFAQMVLAARKKYASDIAWYIMTSPDNHAETVAFFETHDFFGLARGDVMFFSQGTLPAFDRTGKLLLSEKHRLALAPDGHGGSLKALVNSGALADMQRRGVEVISYFQVDNPLVRPFDALFLGLHAVAKSEMSTKITPKASDLERVGNLCLADGKVSMIEYLELPEALAHAKNDDGTRRFDAANLAVHLMDVAMVERIVGTSFELPFRRAEKAVAFVDERGETVTPDAPNAVKLEAFVFDALPLAQHAMLLEVDRREEFSPVKNASGADSLETSHRDQTARACRWLETAGVDVPRNNDGTPDVNVCITPSFALDAEDVANKIKDIPALAPGSVHLLR